MKEYTITVNGNVYQVTVEEKKASGAPSPAPAAVSPPPQSPSASATVAGRVRIVSPMPGKIVGIRVKAGEAVKKGQVVALLEAMKMENEIVAPEDGTVSEIALSNGAQVEAGALILTLS